MNRCKHGIEDDFPCALCRDMPLNWAIPLIAVGCVMFWAWLFSVLSNALSLGVGQ